MKHFFALPVLFMTISAFANVPTYTNNTGCIVEVETRPNGTVYYISQNNKNQVIGHTHDFSSGTFAYCADSALNINSFEGKKGTGIMMSCSEHENGHAVTRGRVDIDIMGGDLKNIKIDGQVKRIIGWKQDVKIECLNLIKK